MFFLAALGAQLLSGAIGAASSAGDRARAVAANQEALKAWLDVNVPDPAAQKVVLQRFVQTGELGPELEAAVKRDATEFEKIQLDPRLKETRMRALSSLEDIGDGGLTLSDRADIERATSDINVMDRGKRESIVDSFARRGQLGSGAALTSQLMGAQGATNRASQMQLDTLAAARKRALDAIMGAGQLAGDIQSDDYKQQSDLAQARDAIAEFNTKNMQGVMNRNVDRRNAANEYNLNLRQKVSDANTKLANDEQIYNKGLIQQEFENKARKAAGLSGQYGKQADAYNDSANRTAGQWAAAGSAIGKGALAYGLSERQPRNTFQYDPEPMYIDSSVRDDDKEKFWESLA